MVECCRCKEFKPEGEFYISNYSKRGFSSKCKNCEKEYQIEYRSNEINKKRKNLNDLKYYYINKDLFSKNRKEYNLKNPTRQKEYNNINLI